MKKCILIIMCFTVLFLQFLNPVNAGLAAESDARQGLAGKNANGEQQLSQDDSGTGFEFGSTGLDEDESLQAKEEKEQLAQKQKQLIVQYWPAAKNKRFSASLISKIKERKKISPAVEIIEVEQDDDIEQVMKDLKSDRQVKYCEKNQLRKLHASLNDTYYSQQWHLENINAEQAWANILQLQKPVVVAVIDSGIDTTHGDLENRIAPGGRNFFPVIPDSNIADVNGHGTAVAGVIAAMSNNSCGVAGVGGIYDVKILPLRTAASDGNSCVTDVVAAIYYAIEQGVDVINLSMGSTVSSLTEAEAIRQAYQAGIVIVASAGNDGSYLYNYPASYENVVSAGSISRLNTISSFSNYNDAIDVVAPGEEIWTTERYNTYGGKHNGTSFSAPIVAGMAALIKGVNPLLSPDNISLIIEATSRDLGAPNKDDFYGYGAVDLKEAVLKASPPVITLNGVATVYIGLGNDYLDDGATAWDTLDGDLSANIVVNNPVDTNQPGTYMVRYSVCDSDGNQSQEISRVVIVTENQPPQAGEVRIEGTAQVGQALTGTYVYYDPDGDSEGQSAFKWYRADDAEGTNKAEIQGANDVRYTVLAEDLGKYIFFDVSPAAASGIPEGTPVLSSAVQVQEGCFIATAAYGSYLDPHVTALRQFRDNVLLSRVWGRKFVCWYYQNSPPIAAYIARRPEAKIFTRLILTPLILFVAYPRVSGLIILTVILMYYLPGRKREMGRI